MTTKALYDSVQTIRLYGVLGNKFGRVHRMAVSSMSEAIRALGSQLRGFEAFLTQSKDNGLAYAVFYGKENLKVDQLHDPVGGRDIRIAPMIIGAKNGGIFSIILGAVLVVVGFALVATGIGGPLGAALINMGLALALGGIVQLLTPVPKGSAKDRPENTASDVFNGPINTQAQGNPVPVLYGELIVGSAVISAGINAKDHTIVPTTGVPTGGYIGGGATPDFINRV